MPVWTLGFKLIPNGQKFGGGGGGGRDSIKINLNQFLCSVDRPEESLIYSHNDLLHEYKF